MAGTASMKESLKIVVVLVCVVFGCSRAATDDDLFYDVFPDDFMWSTATSAYQIEGAWNEDGQ